MLEAAMIFSISALFFAHNEFVASNAQSQISGLKILIFNLYTGRAASFRYSLGVRL